MISSRASQPGINDSGIHSSQSDMNADQVLRILDGVLETEDLTEENREAIVSARRLLEQPRPPQSNEFTVELNSHYSFDDIVGHDEVKSLLTQSLVLPLRQPQLFSEGDPIRNILLYGPPGTGKTLLAKCAASQLGLPFLAVSCSSLLSSYFGESERKIASLFATARSLSNENQPCVIFFDEIDSVTRKRSSNEDEVTRRVKSELLREIDGIDSNKSDVFIFGCSNCPWDIDDAFIRRFARRILIDLPTLEARSALLKRKMSEIDSEKIMRAAVLLQGYSGSDIVNVVNQARHYPMADMLASSEFEIMPDGSMRPAQEDSDHDRTLINCTWEDIPQGLARTRAVSFEDLIKAIDTVKPTVPTELVTKHRNYFI